MKTSLLCGLFFALLLVGIPCQAQPSLGFSNLDGFPDVVVQGTQYNLSGWIVNSGNTAFSGAVNIKMELNATVLLPVGNSFQISNPLQPGDSVYWTENNHNFPPGQFRLGNNDVLIWPTAPSGQVDADTLGKPVYYIDGAAFMLRSSGFDVLGEGFMMDREYSFTCFATNIGTAANTQDVQLFAKIAGYAPQLVTETMGVFDVGQDVEFSILDFNLGRAFGLSEDQVSTSGIEEVEFYVLEENANFEPFNSVSVNVLQQAVGIMNPSPQPSMNIYPNPCADFLLISLPANCKAGMVTVSDMTGRQLIAQPLSGNGVDISSLPAGAYLLKVGSNIGDLHQPFIRQ